MRYALIMAGGSGKRLWPLSHADEPKQLIPFIGGRSLLEIAVDRLDGLVPADQQYICAGQEHRPAILKALDGFPADGYIAEPTGRDTLNAVGLSAAVIARRDPEAVIAVFTADHIIEPVRQFQGIVEQGYLLAEESGADDTLVTFGIEPTHAATGYGYLKLGDPTGPDRVSARIVDAFKEKPDHDVAEQYHEAGPEQYLWNSGMFVWPARTLLTCIQRYVPQNYDGLKQIADAWETDRRDDVLTEIYPDLPRQSVDYGVMEPASADDDIRVAAVPMPLTWLDVGSWPAYLKTLETDADGNGVGQGKAELMESRDNLVYSDDPEHLIATIGCENLVVVHTDRATLVCPADRAQQIKELYQRVQDHHGDDYV
ncbi:MAG: mannose-1-phosphate guanylyltransferase [Phycisphaeraceae bacterium]|nr:mannose-1-phosphate guanylyltransferase [Phycisphaeraceae bacterium]